MAEDDAAIPTGLSVAQARLRMHEIGAARALPTERIALESALGRVLADDAVAPHDVPGFANSAMDGFALRAADLPGTGAKPFALVGEIFAGASSAVEVMADACVRITTGAPLPRGADTVAMKEHARVDGNTIFIGAHTGAGANVRPAGEDYRAGELALPRGTQLTPARLGVLASFGFATVQVARRPRAILLTTGDELSAPGSALGPGGIYDSNRYSLGGMLEQHGAELLRHQRLRDDPAALRDALLRAGDDADLIVSSGGVSAGEADFMPQLLADIGQVYFWKVRMKPGMPFLCGRVGRALVCGLPGNPVSGYATFLALLKPALEAMQNARPAANALRARLREPLRKNHARSEFRRATLACDDSGVLWASALAQQGSGMLRGVAEADALIVLPETAREYAQGEVLEILPLPGWMAGRV